MAELTSKEKANKCKVGWFGKNTNTCTDYFRLASLCTNIVLMVYNTNTFFLRKRLTFYTKLKKIVVLNSANDISRKLTKKKKET